MGKYDRVLVGDFVIYFETNTDGYASFVIGKDDNTRLITVDEIFIGKSNIEYRKRCLAENKWELCDEHSQNDMHKRMKIFSDLKLPEKTHYMRLIKLNKLRRKLKDKL